MKVDRAPALSRRRLRASPNFVLAFSLDGRFTGRDGDPDYKPDNDFYVAMNTGPGALTFRIPSSPTGRRWRRLVDTSASSPDDFLTEGEGPLVLPRSTIVIPPFGVVILISEP